MHTGGELKRMINQIGVPISVSVIFRRAGRSGRKLLSAFALIALVAGLFPGSGARAQSDCQTFTQTGKQVCGRFLEYWNQNGGLAQQGYPLTNAANEKSDTNGKTYLTQYFERAVFEMHPENQ